MHFSPANSLFILISLPLLMTSHSPFHRDLELSHLGVPTPLHSCILFISVSVDGTTTHCLKSLHSRPPFCSTGMNMIASSLIPCRPLVSHCPAYTRTPPFDFLKCSPSAVTPLLKPFSARPSPPASAGAPAWYSGPPLVPSIPSI